MNHYRALINGENFLVNFGGKKTLLGFYCTRYVQAKDPEEAELAAVQCVKDDERFKDNPPLNKPWFGKKPKLYIEELHLIDQEDIEELGGFSWYRMDE